jgi:ubiquinone/menaquinone biosynthesis C-methylase UbiE
MLIRQLEPEVMDTREEACDYDGMNHELVNRRFVDDFIEFCLSTPLSARLVDLERPLNLLDVGTGTAQIPIEICSRPLACRVTAIDLACEMLKLAELSVARTKLAERIQLELVDAKQMPYDDQSFEFVISNSIVHHIPDPRTVFAEMGRVLRVGGVLFVRDLLRPQTAAEVDQLVATYAGQENAHSQQMFRASLCAALTLAEVRDLAREINVPESAVIQTTDRHWTLSWLASNETLSWK